VPVALWLRIGVGIGKVIEKYMLHVDTKEYRLATSTFLRYWAI